MINSTDKREKNGPSKSTENVSKLLLVKNEGKKKEGSDGIHRETSEPTDRGVDKKKEKRKR